MVAAAGNSGTSKPAYPARHSADLTNTISVGAYDRQQQLAQFSNRANGTNRQVDAPGVGVYSTLPGNRYGSLSGTSMAAPHVAGVAALMLSLQPNLAVQDLASALIASADRTVSGSNSEGGVNAARAVARSLYYLS